MTHQKSPRLAHINDLANYYLPLIPFGLFIGFILACVLQRFDLAIRALVIAVPSIIAYIFLKRVDIGKRDILDHNIFISIGIRCTPIYGIIYCLSILALLCCSYRPWYYFVLISALFAVICIQIFHEKSSPRIILMEIIFAQLNIFYGIFVTYPLYFGGTDILPHLFFAQVTKLLGSTIPLDLSYGYSSFPLYHIYLAEGSNILGLDLYFTYLLLCVIPFVVVILAIHRIIQIISGNELVALLTCLVYSIMPTVVTYGNYMITRVFAYIGFIFIVLLLYTRQNSHFSLARLTVLIIMSLYVILVHQASILQILFLLSLIFFCEYLTNKNKYLTIKYLTFLCILFLSCWIYFGHSFFTSMINSRFEALNFEDISYLNPGIQQGDIVTYLYSHIDISLLLFFTLCGIAYLLHHADRYSFVYGVFILISLPLFIPSPIQTLWFTQVLLTADRIVLLLSPFFSFAMAYGIILVVSTANIHKEVSALKLLPILIIFTFSFLSIAVTNGNDSYDMPFEKDRWYFNEIELVSLKFIDNIPFGSTMYSDYYISRYIAAREFSKSQTLNLPYYVSNNLNKNEPMADTGYIVLRYSEFITNRLRFASQVGGLIYIFDPTPDNVVMIEYTIQNSNKIFDDFYIEVLQKM